MKKISFIIILSILLNICLNPVFGEEATTHSTSIGYELYKERVTEQCNDYKETDDNFELIYIIDDDEYRNYDIESDEEDEDSDDLSNLERAQIKYYSMMNGIYGCANSVSYYKAYTLILEKLISKNASINSALQSKLEDKRDKIKNLQTLSDKQEWSEIVGYDLGIDGNIKKITKEVQNSCKLTSGSDNSIIKKSVLQQATYELCRYSFYLEYLDKRNEDFSDIDFSTPINSTDIINSQSKKKIEIDIEKENALKIFPIVFQSYSDYENNITIHILLELLREVYDILREEIHKTINPINQVVYKISNAMKY